MKKDNINDKLHDNIDDYELKKKKRRRAKRKKEVIFTLFIVGLFLSAFSVTKFYLQKEKPVVAGSVKDTYINYVRTNPIKDEVESELEKIQDYKNYEEIEAMREADRRRREEEKLEAERLEAEKLEAERIKNEDGKFAYLTFDDGPSEKVTPQILDILRKNNIKATFFVVGNMLDTYPEITKAVVDEGHAIGHHSYGHNYAYLYKNVDNFMSDIRKTEESMKNHLGEDFHTNLVRLPGGSFKRGKFVEHIEENGYISYDWNALNGDAEGANKSETYLINRLKETVKKKKEVIVLMHDTDYKQTTVDSLQKIIDYLKDEGYEFRTLNEKEI